MLYIVNMLTPVGSLKSGLRIEGKSWRHRGKNSLNRSGKVDGYLYTQMLTMAQVVTMTTHSKDCIILFPSLW